MRILIFVMCGSRGEENLEINTHSKVIENRPKQSLLPTDENFIIPRTHPLPLIFFLDPHVCVTKRTKFSC